MAFGLWAAQAVARAVTDDPASIRVFPKPETDDWLVAEFTMPTEAQQKAVDKIDRAVRYNLLERLDSIICFPRTEAEKARARRKNERQKALRRMRRE